MKRIIAVLLAMMLLVTSGCGNSKEETTKIANIVDYVGIWAEEGTSLEDGGIILELFDTGEHISFMYSHWQSAPESRSVDVWKEITADDVKGNKLTVSFEEDSWGGSGVIEVTLNEDNIVCEVKDIHYPETPMFGFTEGTYTLVRNDSIFESLYYEEDPYDDLEYDEEYENGITQTEVFLNDSIDGNKIINDLVECGANVLKIDDKDETLNFVKIGIEKSKDYISNIDAWVIATIKNNNYSVDAKYKINYGYYDIGGWIINSWEMYEHKTTPINFNPSDDKIKSECEKLFTSYEILDHEYTVNEEGIHTHITTFLGVWDAKYVTETHKDTRTFEFINDNWIESWNFEKYSIDFSKVIGTWQFKHYDEYITINITDIVREKDTYYVTYDYKTSPWCDDGRWGGYITQSSYKTDGSSRIEPSKKTKVELYRNEELDYYMSAQHYGGWSDKLARIDELAIRYSWGNWEGDHGDAYNLVYIDVEKGLYIEDFHYGYKSEKYVTPENGTYYETWWGGDDMTTDMWFTKIN